MQKELQSLGDVGRAADKNAYFKNLVKHRGLYTSSIDETAKKMIRMDGYVELTTTDKLDVALGLLRSEFAEDKHASWIVLSDIHKQVTKAHIDLVKEVFKQGHVNNWGTCDCLSKFLRKWTLLSEENTR